MSYQKWLLFLLILIVLIRTVRFFFKELSIIGNFLSKETFLNFCLKKEEGTEFFSLKAIQHFGTVYFPHTKRSQTRTNN